MKKINFIAFLLISNMSSAFAFPKAAVDSLDFNPSLLSQSIKSTNYNFEGIVKLSNCSGSLVQLEGQSDDAKAIVLTNGHCVPKTFFGGLLDPGEVVVNKRVSRSMKLFLDLDTMFNIKATKIIYATMTDTDMALYELNESYSDILKRTGVSPLTLVSSRPIVGTGIEIISGYWEKGYSCGIDGFVYSLLEAGYTFTDSIRYTDGCETIGGTSGSPIISYGTREVIAVNNTRNESGEECTMNNPCEVDEFGQTFFKQNLRYGQQTYKVYACLTSDFELSLDLPSCELPK